MAAAAGGPRISRSTAPRPEQTLILSITLGPIAISSGQLVLVVACGAGLAAAWGVDRAAGQRPVHVLLDAVLLGLLAGRVAFVVQYFPEYQGDPLAMIDIRDGGFLLPWGMAAASAFVGWWLWRTPTLRRSILSGVAAGTATWALAAGTIALLDTQDRRLPETTLTTLDGEAVALPDYAGAPLVVNLWATWCPPCRREMPVLEAARERHPDVTFVFANQGETADTVRAYLEAEDLALEHVLLDPRRTVGEAVGSRGLPTTLFYGAGGGLVDAHLGPLSRASLAQGLDRLRTAPRPAATRQQPME